MGANFIWCWRCNTMRRRLRNHNRTRNHRHQRRPRRSMGKRINDQVFINDDFKLIQIRLEKIPKNTAKIPHKIKIYDAVLQMKTDTQRLPLTDWEMLLRLINEQKNNRTLVKPYLGSLETLREFLKKSIRYKARESVIQNYTITIFEKFGRKEISSLEVLNSTQMPGN